jgi:ketosteroid isomerase-like protein
MLKNFITLTIIILFSFYGCKENVDENKLEILKKEIVQTETDFALLTKKEGIEKAFVTFAAEDAVINRTTSLLKGKEEIKKFYANQTLKDIKLDWKPDFVDVSKSGDLGYTYGHYTFSAVDTSGKTITDEGIFHTVWKKQKDGSWKFVWD